MPRTEEVDREELINAIWRARGKVSAAAIVLGVSARTIRNYAMKYSTVRAAIDSARADWDDQLLDVAESKLYDEVKDGRPWAIKYALSTKGRSRGYVERQEHEVTGASGGAVTIRIEGVIDDAGDG